VYKKFGKRLLDLALAIAALPFFLAILLIIGPMIYIQDRGSIFYNAPRMGKDGKVFKMYKFRSMCLNAPDLRNTDGSTYSGENDPRVTKVGKIMRKTSIDELPQIINVLKGDMSFIGPRPNLANRSYDTFDDIRKKRVSVSPGITGYSQAYFRNSITQDEKFINDCYYVDHVSFLFDVKIFFKTVASVILRKNIDFQESFSSQDHQRMESLESLEDKMLKEAKEGYRS
jgi:undecaprenyl phosphate N,N'-diacetylbacillosamine 1-phosphate transferase